MILQRFYIKVMIVSYCIIKDFDLANIDYPVFMSKESVMLVKKRTTREDKYLQSEIKLKLYQSFKKIKKLKEQKYEEEGKLLVDGYDAKQVK